MIPRSIVLMLLATMNSATIGLHPQRGSPLNQKRDEAIASCTGLGANSFVANNGGNVAAGAEASVVGGTLNTVCDDKSTVGAGTSNLINSGNNSATNSLIAAGQSNFIALQNSFVGAGALNKVASSTSAIVAGSGNTTEASDSWIGAGSHNSIGFGFSNIIGGGEFNSITSSPENGIDDRAIGGGYGNQLTSCASCVSTPFPPYDGSIGGGYQNSASGQGGVISGGSGNVVSGADSVVVGGYHNFARSTFGFAAGFGSYALGVGSFVWSDLTHASHLTSVTQGQFLVRATGGVILLSNPKSMTGVYLAPGSGSWSSISDRNVKKQILPVDDGAILRRLMSVPVTEWSYRSEGHVRHVGPMAQDFYSAFRLGADDRHITSIDEGGVALAALKDLARQNAYSTDFQAAMQSRLGAEFEIDTTLEHKMSKDVLAGKTHIMRRRAADCSGQGAGSFLANMTSNVADASEASILGGSINISCDADSSVGAGTENIVASGSVPGSRSLIAGGGQNSMSSVDSFIGAGLSNQMSSDAASVIFAGSQNQINSSNDAIIGSGTGNDLVSSDSSTIGAGDGNIISSGGFNGSASDGTILAGVGNTIGAAAINGAQAGYIGGGGSNVLSGSLAVVGGGDRNVGGGMMSVVPGGYGNQALGNFSFAAGFMSHAIADGSFVWSGDSEADSNVPNSFTVRAPGGVSMYSDAAATTGVMLAPGSGSWASASDRFLKIQISTIDYRDILRSLSSLPISAWSYRSEDGVRHIGPMAQDFYRRFRVGEDDRHIATIDEDGVALAAIKALHREDEYLSANVRALEQTLGSLHDKNVQLAREFHVRDISNAPPCSGIGGGSFLANNQANVAAGAYSSVGAGHSNSVCDRSSVIFGGSANAIESSAGTGQQGSFLGAGFNNLVASQSSFVGGGEYNEVTGGSSGAIGSGSNNLVDDSPEAVIAGGASNVIRHAKAATILGGSGNIISALSGQQVQANAGFDDTIIGGTGNMVLAERPNQADYDFIGGGQDNLATGTAAVVVGGSNNVASGFSSTVAGGYGNIAAGDSSFAAGYEAHALSNGSFVWADYSPASAPLTTTTANQFLVRASGGTTFYSGVSPSMTGVMLSPGSGTWASSSDRNLKANVKNVAVKEILTKIEGLPLSDWSYRSQFGVRHIGPMAQDFYSRFKLGPDNRHITTIDEDGIVLAAINALVSEQHALRSRTIQLVARLDSTLREESDLRREIDTR